MKTFCKIIFLFFFINSISSLDKQKDCNCRILPESKIVGGKQTHQLAYPWIVSITLNPNVTSKSLIPEDSKIKTHTCGGSIINERWVMTAANCIPEDTNEPLYVGFGNDNDLVKIFDFGRIKSVRTIKNPDFSENKFKAQIFNDIALVELEKPIEFTENVKPACFLNEKRNLYSGFLEHAGWGGTNIVLENTKTGLLEDLNISRYLKEMFLFDESDSNDNCKSNDKVICAKGSFENESSCKGDTGSPAHYTKNGKSYVIGLASYSNEEYIEYIYRLFCVGSTVFTRVESYIDWMKLYVEDDICEF